MLNTEVPVQSQEGGTCCGEVKGDEDAPVVHGYPAYNGGQGGGHVQWQDLQPGGSLTTDDEPCLGEFSNIYKLWGMASPASGPPTSPASATSRKSVVKTHVSSKNNVKQKVFSLLVTSTVFQ